MPSGEARGLSRRIRPSGRRLTVVVADGAGRPLPKPGLTRWLARLAPTRVRGIISVALISDSRMRGLNRRFRGVDRVTDVLSFPADDSGRSPFLGDIAIASGLARRQARARGHSELAELRVLALHGLLHLLGYDHQGDNGRMERLERRLRRLGGLRHGLIERAP
jgi:probable rRNA maturation factor